MLDELVIGHVIRLACNFLDCVFLLWAAYRDLFALQRLVFAQSPAPFRRNSNPNGIVWIIHKDRRCVRRSSIGSSSAGLCFLFLFVCFLVFRCGRSKNAHRNETTRIFEALVLALHLKPLIHNVKSHVAVGSDQIVLHQQLYGAVWTSTRLHKGPHSVVSEFPKAQRPHAGRKLAVFRVREKPTRSPHLFRSVRLHALARDASNPGDNVRKAGNGELHAKIARFVAGLPVKVIGGAQFHRLGCQPQVRGRESLGHMTS
mmetsp:Transcript_73472/g.119245  ORF Transcript_73472/g.119245 Transcript_73472/m.119245 type:complete len:258 (+) Transcript_73472:1493-2266(+)